MASSDVDKGMAKKILKHYCSTWNELRYDEIRNKSYFIGKKSKESATEILFPLNCYKAMTFDELKTCIVDSGSTSVNMAIYNSDSTVVLYKAELGLKSPIHHKENKSCPASDDTIVTKIDLASDSVASSSVSKEQNPTTSSTDFLQIDLHPDSDLSETENEESSTCSDDK